MAQARTRVTRDRAGRWHVAFAAVPSAVPAPGNGAVVGVDRGVVVSAALSTGQLLNTPGLHPAERLRLRLLERRMVRQRKGSRRREQTKLAIARLKTREADRRRDRTEKTSTDLARRFDLSCVEDLDVRALTSSASGTIERPGRGVRQKAGLNREPPTPGVGAEPVGIPVRPGQGGRQSSSSSLGVVVSSSWPPGRATARSSMRTPPKPGR